MEKAVSIGFYFVASGVYTVIGRPLPVVGAPNLHKYLTEEIEEEVGGKWAFEVVLPSYFVGQPLLKGKALVMALGYSHPVRYEPAEGIEIEVPDPKKIAVKAG